VARMFAAGAKGYLRKDCAFREIIQAIKTVVDDQSYISPSIAGKEIWEYLRELDSTKHHDPLELTNRERRILRLIATGITTKQIAQRLHLSVKAIEKARHLMMEKLDLHSIAELTKYAVSEGLTPLEP
jgi:DNA-binding NarL/FixJ family response regulator